MKNFIVLFVVNIIVDIVGKYSVASITFYYTNRCSDFFFDGKDLG